MTIMVLDLYAGLGGAGEGYRRGGCIVHGVDIEDQPDYVAGSFIKADALDYAARHGHRYDFIHSSPMCKASSALTRGTNWSKGWGKAREWRDQIPDTRRVLDQLGKPYCIENVQGSRLRRDLILCGEMFGLRVIRHRYFEFSGIRIPRISHPEHRGRVAGWRHGVYYEGYYFAVYGDGGGKGSVADWQNAMGIHWTTNKAGIREAIPPAYTEYIAQHLVKGLS